MAAIVGDPLERALAAKQAAEEDLLFGAFSQALLAESGTEGFSFENIVGVGVTERMTSGHPTGEPAVAVYVIRKATLNEVDGSAVVPREYDGVPTDVIESGEFVASTGRGRYRPASSGVSVGHSE